MGWHPSMSSVLGRAESPHAVQYTLTMQSFKLYYSNVICSLCQLPAFYYVNVVLYLICNPPQNHAFKLNFSVRLRSTPGTETHNNMQPSSDFSTMDRDTDITALRTTVCVVLAFSTMDRDTHVTSLCTEVCRVLTFSTMDRGTVQPVPCRVSGQWTEAHVEERHSRPEDQEFTDGRIALQKKQNLSKKKLPFDLRKGNILVWRYQQHERQCPCN